METYVYAVTCTQIFTLALCTITEPGYTPEQRYAQLAKTGNNPDTPTGNSATVEYY